MPMLAPSHRPSIRQTSILLLCTLLLTACGEVLNEFYLTNNSDQDVHVLMMPRFIEQVDLHAGALGETVTTSVRSELTQTLPFDQQGDAIRFTLPPSWTVFIGFSGGGQLAFERLEVENGDAIVIDASNYRDHFSIHDRLVGAIIHSFSID